MQVGWAIFLPPTSTAYMDIMPFLYRSSRQRHSLCEDSGSEAIVVFVLCVFV